LRVSQKYYQEIHVNLIKYISILNVHMIIKFICSNKSIMNRDNPIRRLFAQLLPLFQLKSCTLCVRAARLFKEPLQYCARIYTRAHVSRTRSKAFVFCKVNVASLMRHLGISDRSVSFALWFELSFEFYSCAVTCLCIIWYVCYI